MNPHLLRKLRLKKLLPKDKPRLLKGNSALRLFPDEPFLYCKVVDELIAIVHCPNDLLTFFVTTAKDKKKLHKHPILRILQSRYLNEMFDYLSSDQLGSFWDAKDSESVISYLPAMLDIPYEINLSYVPHDRSPYHNVKRDRDLLIYNPGLLAVLKILNHEPPERIRKFLLLHRSRINLIVFYMINSFWLFFTGHCFDLPPIEDLWTMESQAEKEVKDNAGGTAEGSSVSADFQQALGNGNLLPGS